MPCFYTQFYSPHDKLVWNHLSGLPCSHLNDKLKSVCGMGLLGVFHYTVPKVSWNWGVSPQGSKLSHPAEDSLSLALTTEGFHMKTNKQTKNICKRWSHSSMNCLKNWELQTYIPLGTFGIEALSLFLWHNSVTPLWI